MTDGFTLGYNPNWFKEGIHCLTIFLCKGIRVCVCICVCLSNPFPKRAKIKKGSKISLMTVRQIEAQNIQLVKTKTHKYSD